jgi:PAS domain S-box-containing protein
MRFYQTIYFRLILSTVLLVATVAFLLVGHGRQQSRQLLRDHARREMIRETNLVSRMIASQAQQFRSDVLGLANSEAVRKLRWVERYNLKEMQQYEPPDEMKKLAPGHFDKGVRQFLASQDHYLQVDFYLHADDTKKHSHSLPRQGLRWGAGGPLSVDEALVRRATAAKGKRVVLSGVRVWDLGGERVAVQQAGFVLHGSVGKDSLVVVTARFDQTARLLTRYARHAVFLADESGRPLLYPQPGKPPSYVLGGGEGVSDESRRFTEGWLTDEKGMIDLDPLASLNGPTPRRSPLALRERYAPGGAGRGDDEWAPPDLAFLLLRCQVSKAARADNNRRKQLEDTLHALGKEYPTLTVEAEVAQTTDELLVRAFTPHGTSDEDARRQLAAVRQRLRKTHAADVSFPDRAPLRCTRFVRVVNKIDLGGDDPAADSRLPGTQPCFYLGIAVPLELIDARIDDTLFGTFLVAIGCVAGAVGLAVLISVLITRPLRSITTATQQLAAGGNRVCLPERDTSEIGVLARSFAVMARQVQERQREVADREARLQTILDSAAEAILTLTEDGVIRSFNRAAERLFGYPAGEAVGLPLARLVEDPGLSAAMAAGGLPGPLADGQLGESVGRRKDGAAFPLEYGGSRVPGAEPTLLTLILRDITWRKEREEAARLRNEVLEQRVHERTADLEAANAELALARDKAEQAAVAKDFFLATVSHELRNPLNHVLGFVQLLEMTPLDEGQAHDLRRIGSAAVNLLTLVNDLLDYQKIIQGGLTLQPRVLSLRPWLEELADGMGPKVRERGNRLVVDCPADAGEVVIDETRVRQVLTNLLSNAAKFCRDGTVTLSARREDDGAGGWLSLAVCDTGRGMTPDQQAKLFRPFTKLLAPSENPGGTGLGLALSQRLCRLMGGDLTLTHSAPNAGSAFTARLPALPPAGAAAARPAAPAPAVRPSAPRAARTVLVIDDDPEACELMRRHLGEQGFTVRLANSGVEGLAMARLLRPDAITLDVLMPGMDGWETLAGLQADPLTAHIPVILVTMLDDRSRGYALGAWEVLSKPVSWSRLIALLRAREPAAGPILLIDDDTKFCELARRTLATHCWEVVCAADGRAALALAAQGRPALVLLDLLMPVMDGFAFIDEFRKNPAWAGVPVVVMTAKDLTAEDHARLDGAVLRILPKGMGALDDLLQDVERLLSHPPAPAAGAAGQPA